MTSKENEYSPVEKRVEDLLDRMTLEEMILQTDQYISHDFTIRERKDGMEAVVSLDMDKLDSLLRGNSVGSIQTRELTPSQINELQRYAVETRRSFRSRSAWPQPSGRSWGPGWAEPSEPKPAPWVSMKPTAR